MHGMYDICMTCMRYVRCMRCMRCMRCTRLVLLIRIYKKLAVQCTPYMLIRLMYHHGLYSIDYMYIYHMCIA